MKAHKEEEVLLYAH